MGGAVGVDQFGHPDFTGRIGDLGDFAETPGVCGRARSGARRFSRGDGAGPSGDGFCSHGAARQSRVGRGLARQGLSLPACGPTGIEEGYGRADGDGRAIRGSKGGFDAPVANAHL